MVKTLPIWKWRRRIFVEREIFLKGQTSGARYKVSFREREEGRH
jgi:hypothetical protein